MALGGLLVYLLLVIQATAGGASHRHLDTPEAMSQETKGKLMAAVAVHQAAAQRAADLMAANGGPGICEDTCFKARDGVCDDGRHLPNMTSSREVYIVCDLGTDCQDCGPWKGVKHTTSWKEPVGPVEFLRRRNIQMRAKQTSVSPRFWFAYTSPDHDVDVSAQMVHGGVVERGISHIAYHVLHRPCTREGKGLLADVGGNFGWFSVFAGMMGCSAVSWEPVPQFRAFFEYNVARNRLQDRVQIRPTVAVAYPGRGNYTVVVPQRGIWGTAGIDGANIDNFIDNEGQYERINVTGETLDQVLGGRHVHLLKVDVEGFEADVMQGAERLLSGGRADNIIMEYSPHVAEKAHRYDELYRSPSMLLSLIDKNYTIGNIAEKAGLSDITNWSQALGLLDQVTAQNLKYDLGDTKLITNTGMMWGREPCTAMTKLALLVEGMPERFHPKSFRSVFGFNTNIWASRMTKFAPHLMGPPVGILPANQSVRESWFPPEGSPEIGMGGRGCQSLREDAKNDRLAEDQRASLLVSHHCRCGPAMPCRRAEAVAEECARKGQIPFED